MSESAAPALETTSRAFAARGVGIARCFALAGAFYAVFLAGAMAMGVLLALFGQTPDMPLDVFAVILIPQVAAWLIAIVLGLQWGGTSFREACPLKSFPLGIVPALLVASFGATILLNEVAMWIPMPEFFRESWTRQFAESSKPALFVSVVVVAPLAEELFFRGLVLRGYLVRYSVTTAVWASAIFFAVFHLNPWQAVVALPLGVWYAYLVMRTGSLLPAMLSHATVNFSTSFLLVPTAKLLGYTADELEASDHIPPLMLGVAAGIFAVAGLIHWRQLAQIAPASYSFDSDTEVTGVEEVVLEAVPAGVESPGENPQAPMS